MTQVSSHPSFTAPAGETRAVRSEELEAMLGIMCDSFGLPYAAARELFYKDPYFDVSRKRVLVEHDTLVSCLTVVDADLWIGAAPVRVGGIAGVATRASERGKGYASRLLLGTLGPLRELGCVLSALFPYSYDFYRRLGWERVGTQYRLVSAPAALPRFSEGRHVREAGSGDRAEIERLYEAHARGRAGWWLRDARRWEYLRMHVKHTAIYRPGELEGYAFYEVRETSGSRHLRVLEVVATTEAARRAFAGFFALSDAHELSYTGSLADLEASGLLAARSRDEPEAAARVEEAPGGMFRVLDLAACLVALRPNFPAENATRGEVTLVMRDPQAGPGRPATIAAILECDGSAWSIRSAPTLRQRSERLGGAGEITGDAAVWAQVITGHLSLRDALSLNRLHATSDAAAAFTAQLFPRRDLFIPLADHF